MSTHLEKDPGACLRVSEATIGNYRNMIAAPKIEFVDRFCREFRFSAEWFVRGIGEPFPGARVRHSDVCGDRPIAEALELRKGEMPETVIPAAGHVSVPVARMTLSPDGHPIQKESAGFIPFRRDSLAIDPQNAVMLTVEGDEMTPAFHPGDMLMVDQDQIDVRSGQIYAVSLGESLLQIKRLEARGAKIRVISDNRKTYEPFLIDRAELQVVGKVVWHCRQL